MSLCGGFGYTLWAIGLYETVQQNLKRFPPMGPGTRFGYMLWVLTKDLLCATGHSAGFGYALWATNYHGAEVHNSF